MGSELVNSASPISYSDKLEELFPFYLSIGMTTEQYWDESPCLAIPFRKAHILLQKRKNDEAWMMGSYVYNALKAVVPALRGLSKEPIEPYLEEPYPFTKEDVEEYKRKQALKQREHFSQVVQVQNKKLKERKQEVKKNNA